MEGMILSTFFNMLVSDRQIIPLMQNIEICRLYELDHISSNIMKVLLFFFKNFLSFNNVAPQN
jgi:hypothetical protein